MKTRRVSTRLRDPSGVESRDRNTRGLILSQTIRYSDNYSVQPEKNDKNKWYEKTDGSSPRFPGETNTTPPELETSPDI